MPRYVTHNVVHKTEHIVLKIYNRLTYFQTYRHDRSTSQAHIPCGGEAHSSHVDNEKMRSDITRDFDINRTS